ncbi:hypothetical protein AB4305_13165 [Nocardia sp. 2YAB30]|uniref:hypothetical protein n=1 Tax=unclassified Nocardia TaxID=2637762 RepID=UPI003F9D0BDA
MCDEPERHFAGRQQHVSRYSIPDGDVAFERTVEVYRAGKGRPGPPRRAGAYDLFAQTATRPAEQR